MKRKILTTVSIAAAMTMAAQGLAMPDGTTAPDAQADTAAAAPAPVRQPKHNTPSTSYKAERNDIRHGNSAFEKEKYHQALTDYDRALEVNGGSIRAKYNKAVTLLQLQSDDNKDTANDPRKQAAALFQELIADARTYAPDIAAKAYYNLGNMAFNDQQYDGAIEMYKSSLRIDPANQECRENLRLAQLKKEEQENQDQNQDQQQQDQQQQQQDQQQQDQQDQQQQEQQQQQQQQPMTLSAQQILQSMQNKENQTRKKVQQGEPAVGRPQSDKPW